MCKSVCMSSFALHTLACVIVSAQICMRAHTCASVCLHALWYDFERMCWEHAADVFNFKDAGTLCCVRLHADRLSLMNNYLQQCKTNPLIMMRCWATFQHDSPWSLLCSTLICVSQSCLWINNAATFLSAPSGMLSCGLLPCNSQCFAGEHCSRADACKYLVFQSRSACVHACSKFILWNWVKQSNRVHRAVLCSMHMWSKV